MNKKECTCHPDCPYFPDVSITSSQEWKFSDDGFYKVRKTPKTYICDYDGLPIESWNRVCRRS